MLQSLIVAKESLGREHTPVFRSTNLFLSQYKQSHISFFQLSEQAIFSSNTEIGSARQFLALKALPSDAPTIAKAQRNQ
ncbi:hypothetical protein VVR26_08665 [Corynebacterium camporealensis]|uniref:hypothetical protein n=1 Tax=Corynebacterium camporealensis TaxID=161896 RepID=UPI0034CDC9B6